MLPGSPTTFATGLVRRTIACYAAVATKEGIPAPTIQVGREFVDQIHAPPRIVFVIRRGPVGPATRFNEGNIGSDSLTIKAHVWSVEPEVLQFTANELEDRLARFDASFPMTDRLRNVLSRVAPGMIEVVDMDTDAGIGGENSGNTNGETCVLVFRFTRDIPRDNVVFSIPAAALLSPPDPLKPPGTVPATIVTNVSAVPQG